MLRPGTFALTALLAALSAIGPLTTDMYLPSLPDIARQLNAWTGQAQFTIFAYLIGFAVGQIFYGPVSDRHGRKPVLIAAIALYCVASLAWRSRHRSRCSLWRALSRRSGAAPASF
jgi:DHA1 family bicyclomycin/chloramphenicol resistance-like MFS transporter